MNRPNNLPEYKDPPLNEVVLSVQFQSPKDYQQIYARDVWSLFRDDFPVVQEYPAVPPTFETFGRSPGQSQAARIHLSSGVGHDRYWFVSKSQDELIQFQNDRLMHNWRKTKEKGLVYPRFDNIRPKFEAELKRLEEYYIDNFQNEPLVINQCELTYVNIIPYTKEEELSKWLLLQNIKGYEGESFSLNTTKILHSKNGAPYARLFCNCSTGFNDELGQLIDLRFIVRGTAKDTTIQEALEFMNTGRIQIVNSFDQITTKYAHSHWGKKT